MEPPQCQGDPVIGLKCYHEVLCSNQLASSIWLSMGNTMVDLLKDLDQKILSSQSNFKTIPRSWLSFFLFLQPGHVSIIPCTLGE